MADIAKLITQLDEALRDESTASDLRRVARILIGDPVVQTTIAPPYASTSRVERIAEDFSELRDQVAVLDDIVHGRIRPADVPDQQAHIESLAAYIQRVETDLGERLTAVDRARVRGDDSMHDLVTRTANSIYAEIKKLEQRISDCELAVGTDTLDGAPTPNIPANDPEPLVDTSWHPFNFSVDLRPDDDKNIVVLTRDDEIWGPRLPVYFNWADQGPDTIVAWRYAKEGE